MTVRLGAAVVSVTVPASGQLWLSQARGEPALVELDALVVEWGADLPVTVRLRGLVRAGCRSVALSGREGRSLEDLEGTNPGLLDQLRSAVPSAPWPQVP